MSDRLVNAVTRVCLMSHGGLMIMYRGVSSHSILPIINFSIILPLGSIIMLIITFLFNLIGRHSDAHFIESLPKSFIGMVFHSSSIYYCKSIKIISVTTGEIKLAENEILIFFHLVYHCKNWFECGFRTLKRFGSGMSTSNNF